ncbi:hypothetical protein, partial [Klebsiella pneumoniae]
ASDSTQHAIGTGVFGGMISGTLLAIRSRLIGSQSQVI